MGPGSKTPYNPSDNSAPFMVLPEHVYGFIDLKTLADIHRYLSESEAEEDIVLANWVKENYLYEPIDEGGRTIRTTEGFSNLDRAYRRVRSLTNKAQDKWPFFDRNWKHMSSTTVRNNARGEAAPGISLPGMYGETHASPAPNGVEPTKDSLAPRLQVPFGTKQPSRYSALGKHHPRLSQQTPVTLPTTSKKREQLKDLVDSVSHPTLSEQSEPEPESMSEPGHQAPSESLPQQEFRKPTDLLSESENQTSTPPKAPLEEEPKSLRAASEVPASEPVHTTAVSDQPKSITELEVEPSRDAGSGKVRGPNGRYLPKDNSSPISSVSRRKPGSMQGKGARAKFIGPMFKSNSRASTDNVTIFTEVQSPSTPTQDDGFVDNLCAEKLPASEANAHTFTPANDNDDLGERATSEPTSQAHSNDITSDSSTPSGILAAEAEAVASNLDRLPPGSARRTNKRKSESLVQQDQRKRGRHGGIVGRPRKSEQQAAKFDQDMVKASQEKEQSLSQSVAEEAPRMTTRRTARRSAASTLNSSTSQNSVSVQDGPKKRPKTVEGEDVVMEDADRDDINGEDTTAGHEAHAPAATPFAKKPTPFARAKVATPIKSDAQPHSVSSTSVPQLPLSDTDLLAIGLSKTSSPARRSNRKQPKTPKSVIMQQSGKSTLNTPKGNTSAPAAHLTNGTTNETPATAATATHTPGHVEYFARVHTFTGTVEVPVMAEKLDNAENELIKKYAEWMAQEGGMDISFKQFRSIFGFAKKG
ncbi:Nn.00g078640.m01.CDS01 [Neocucurbitaria sp. VM-36]